MDPSKSANASGASAWIQNRFIKRECVCIVPTSKDSNKCGCGRYLASHYYFEEEEEGNHDHPSLRWSISRCTGTYATDAFGTLSFQGVHGPNKSQYIRLDFSTEPSDIWRLLVEAWGMEPPKLVITVHGGSNNFELSPNIIRSMRKGLLKAAKTTNAWIITSGIRMGVVKHVVSALSENFSARKQKFTVIGIVPWGGVRRNEDLINVRGGTIPYYPQSSTTKTRSVGLCEGHTCFLLVDNGTIGRSGAEIFLRRRFEEYLRQQPLGNSSRRMPLVSLVLGGGRSTLQAVLANVTSNPPVPVVTFAGSGRAADVLAFVMKHDRDEKEVEESFKRQLVTLISESFAAREVEAQKIMKTVMLCSKWKNLVTVFNSDKSEDSSDELDCVILNTLLNGHNLSPVDRLGLLLTWNRDDMAKEIFEKGHDWPEGSLNQAMMYALISDRVEFVQLLLNNGMAMDKFLTYSRLEELYNTDRGPLNTLQFILQDVVKDPGPNYKYKLPHIGLIIEKLMGSGYRSTYNRQDFRRRYKLYSSQQRRFSVRGEVIKRDSEESGGRKMTLSLHNPGGRFGSQFQHPFHELFLWAVLTKRHEMAMLMWNRGEEPLAKALVGFKLNKSLAKEAEDDYLEVEVCQQFKKNANEFKVLAYDLVEQLYQTDDDLTLQLLTCELKQWSRKNCLSLASLSNYKKFLAHASCQMLLADLWLGGLRVRKKAHIKVILSVILPPLIPLLQFKTQEQLLLQAQTAEEFHENRPGLNADDESDASSSSSGVESSDEEIGESNDDIESGTGTVAPNGLPLYKTAQVEIMPMRPRLTSRLSSMSSASLRPQRTISHQLTGARVWFSPGSRALLVQTPLEKNGNVPLSDGHPIKSSLPPRDTSISELQELTVTPRHSSDIAITTESECNTPSAHRKLLPHLFEGKHKLHSMLTLNFKLPESEGKPPHPINFEKKLSLKRNQELSLKKKIREFYQAPIACFWSFVIGYFFFLGCYTYTVLVQTLPQLRWPEYYVIAFITTFACDQVRRVLLQEPKGLLSKLKVYSQSWWDVLSCAACLMFFFALFFRVSPVNDTMMAGRVMYCCNIVFWYMRILHLLTVSSMLGPFITMYGKMVAKMFLLSNILFVVLASFGVLRQSILFPYEEWHWALLRNIAYKPYFMLYGELYAEEIDVCGDDGKNCDIPGIWLTPFFMTIYLLLSIIVFVNMMIAAFNFVFLEVNSQAHIIWKFQRFEQVMEYEQQPFLPAPFIIFVHIYLIAKFIYKRLWKRDKVFRFEHSLKLFLSESELDKLHDFERECLEEMIVKKNTEKLNSTDERVKLISERVEYMNQKLDSLYDRSNTNRLLMLLLQEKLSRPNFPLSEVGPVSTSSAQDLHILSPQSPPDATSASDASLVRHNSGLPRQMDSLAELRVPLLKRHRRSLGGGSPPENATLSRSVTWASAMSENFPKSTDNLNADDDGEFGDTPYLRSRAGTHQSRQSVNNGITFECPPKNTTE